MNTYRNPLATVAFNDDAGAVLEAPADNATPNEAGGGVPPVENNQIPAAPNGTVEVPPAKEPELVPVGDIERNGIKATFFCNEFKRGDAKKAGKTYPFPNKLADGAFADLVAFIGEVNAKEILSARLALMCQNWANEAVPTVEVKTPNPAKPGHFIIEDKPTGAPMVWQDFENYVKSFSARGESMAILLDRQNKLTLDLPKIDATTPDGLKKLQEAIGVLSGLAQAIQSKKRKSSDEESD